MSGIFFTSFSGGKDCNLAHHLAVKAGYRPAALLSTVNEDSGRSMSHAIPEEIMGEIADALGLPLVRAQVTWGSYEDVFHERVDALVREYGVTHGVFGDIDLIAHREWEEKVCAPHGVTALLPLWQRPRLELVRQFVNLGFEATIVAVNKEKAPAKYAGRPFDHAVIDGLIADGVDPCGEAGEFHTLVTYGPTFSRRVHLPLSGTVERDKYVFVSFTESR